MKKSYADQCLERAEKATDGPWQVDMNTSCIREGGDPKTKFRKKIHLEHYANPDAPNMVVVDQRVNLEFIANARTDVPELAIRLKRACEALKEAEARMHGYSDNTFSDLADELEAPLEDKL